jgi:hypothetical protein
MIPASGPENIHNKVMKQQSFDRRTGVDRRKGGLKKDKQMRRAADKSEKDQPGNRFIGDFG